MLFSSFTDENSGVFTKECQILKDINDKFKLDIFTNLVRFSDKDKKRWDSNFLIENLKEVKNKIEKIYVVGPIAFMDNLKLSFKESNLNLDEKIFLV